MKVRTFNKRDRRTAGRATGTLICRLSLPATDEVYERRISNNPTHMIATIRKFVERHLSQSPGLLTGARFAIEAEIRASSGGLRRKKLSAWQFGENLESAFETASQEWASLELEEEDWIAVEYLPLE